MDLSPGTLIPIASVILAMLAWAYFAIRSDDPAWRRGTRRST
jgi:hypothetical protein